MVAFGGAELFLRRRPELKFDPRWYVGEKTTNLRRNFESDSITGWRMIPHHSFVWGLGGDSAVYSSNAQGMRASADFPDTCGANRIVMVGDSFFYGTGVAVEKTIGAQLADSLSHRFEVYSVAMPGFGIDQMWMSLRHNALPLCPALVVVGFIDDDFNRSLTAYRKLETMTKPTFVLEADSLRPERPSDKPGAVKLMLRRHSSIWRAIEVASRRLGYRTGRGEWYGLNAAMFEAMAREAKAHKAFILFVRLPARDGWRPMPALPRTMARISAPYIDLADPSLKRLDIHLTGDSHLNALGAGYVAGRIANWIRAAGPETAPKSNR